VREIRSLAVAPSRANRNNAKWSTAAFESKRKTPSAHTATAPAM